MNLFDVVEKTSVITMTLFTFSGSLLTYKATMFSRYIKQIDDTIEFSQKGIRAIDLVYYDKTGDPLPDFYDEAGGVFTPYKALHRPFHEPGFFNDYTKGKLTDIFLDKALPDPAKTLYAEMLMVWILIYVNMQRSYYGAIVERISLGDEQSLNKLFFYKMGYSPKVLRSMNEYCEKFFSFRALIDAKKYGDLAFDDSFMDKTVKITKMILNTLTLVK